MGKGRNWTRQELLLAMNLYCQLPFGQLDHGNSRIIALAGALDRTPGSVAMKLSNLASLDLAITSTGRLGLTGASALDREIWAEFHGDWTRLAAVSEQLAQRLIPADQTPEPPARARARREVFTLPEGEFTGPRELPRTRRERLAQRFFRRAVLASYGVRCCVTGNPVPGLLVASHIVPWSEYPQHQANPRNGLCLEATLDAAFDRHLITFDEDLRLVVGKGLRDYLPNDALQSHILAYEGRKLALPEKFKPEEGLMAVHREGFVRR